MIEHKKTRLATHYARLSDPSASPDIAINAGRSDGLDRCNLIITNDPPFFVGTDKDNYHSNLLKVAALCFRGQSSHDREGLDAAMSVCKSIAALTPEPIERSLDIIKMLMSILLKEGKPIKLGDISLTRDDLPRLGDLLRQLPSGPALKKIRTLLAQALYKVLVSADGVTDHDRTMAVRACNDYLKLSGLGKADSTKLRFVKRIIERDDRLRAEVEEILKRVGQTSRHLAPLRQHLKQIVLPGPAGKKDVVVTPLMSMPLARFVADLHNHVESSAGHRFIRKNRAVGNQQNTGVIGNWFAFRYHFSAKEWLHEPLIDHFDLVGHLVTALYARRIYLSAQKLDVRRRLAARKDLNERVVEAACKIAQSVVENRDITRKVSQDDILEAIKLAYASMTAGAARTRGPRALKLYAPEMILIRLGLDRGMQAMEHA